MVLRKESDNRTGPDIHDTLVGRQEAGNQVGLAKCVAHILIETPANL